MKSFGGREYLNRIEEDLQSLPKECKELIA